MNRIVLLRVIRKSFLNQKRAAALRVISVAAGTTVAASLLAISLDISGKVSAELRAFGANIVIDPKVEGLAGVIEEKRTLREEDLAKAKTIFWRHNIRGLTPFLFARGDVAAAGARSRVEIVGTWYEKYLPLPGEAGTFRAGVKTVAPWWTIEGAWPDTGGEVLVGVSLAEKIGVARGETLLLDGRVFRVAGLLATGGAEDDRIVMDLDELQEFRGQAGEISKVLVSALATPMDDFAARDPETMSPAEKEKWYCTAYVTSIARQLEGVFEGSSARPIWPIAATEGRLLERLQLLIYFLALAALAASVLGVSAAWVTSLLHRAGEIALMKAVGGARSEIMAFFLAEGLAVGLAGGLLGWAASIFISSYIGLHVFQSGFAQRGALLPVAVGCAVLVSLAGTFLPVLRAVRARPAGALRGGA